MGVKRVKAGDPITAHWANSLVTQVETVAGWTTTPNKGNFSHAPVQFSYPAGFQIQMSPSGAWTIEPGCIFINGELVVGNGTTYSHNQTSLQNWSSAYYHKGNELPKWKIKGYIPDTSGTVADSKFWLINENASEETSKSEQPPENCPEGYKWWEQYINEVDEENGFVKQIISGTIFISTAQAANVPRPFDVIVVGKVDENPDLETEGDDTGTGTEIEEEEEEKVEFEIRSGWVLLPHKTIVMIPQKLKLEHSTTDPFFVTLNVSRDGEGKYQYKYEMMTQEQLETNYTWEDATEKE